MRHPWRAVMLAGANSLDAGFTAFYVSTGVATEANPLMAFLLSGGVALFLTVKLGVVNALILWLWYVGAFGQFPRGLKVLLTLYGMLLLWHLLLGANSI